MWNREEIQREAESARERAIQSDCHSVPILTKIMMDVAARMALDNAAELAERVGDSEVEDRINALKEMFSLADHI